MAICGVATWVSVISLARRHGFVQAGLAGWVWVLGSGFEFGHGSLSRFLSLSILHSCSLRLFSTSEGLWLSGRCPQLGSRCRADAKRHALDRWCGSRGAGEVSTSD